MPSKNKILPLKQVFIWSTKARKTVRIFQKIEKFRTITSWTYCSPKQKLKNKPANRKHTRQIVRKKPPLIPITSIGIKEQKNINRTCCTKIVVKNIFKVRIIWIGFLRYAYPFFLMRACSGYYECQNSLEMLTKTYKNKVQVAGI